MQANDGVLTRRPATGYDADVTGMARALRAGVESVGGWVVRGRALVGDAGTWLTPVLLLLPTPFARAGSTTAEPPWTAAPSDLQEFAEDSKYDLGVSAASLHTDRHADAEPGDLPSAYDTDRITLLARDPACLFVYWELTPRRRGPALAALGDEADGACQVIRLYAATTGDTAPTISCDVELPADLGSRYLTVASPGASCRAEIGLRSAAGRFLPLVSSNTVVLPSAAPSADTSVQWTEIGPPAAASR